MPRLNAIKEFLTAKLRLGPDFGKFVRLCTFQKAEQAAYVYGVGAVIVGIVAHFIAACVHKVTDNE